MDYIIDKFSSTMHNDCLIFHMTMIPNRTKRQPTRQSFECPVRNMEYYS